MLEALVLENNKLGSTGSAHFWFILLRVLNLNSNAIRTLCPLIPAYLDESQQQRQPSELLSIDPNVLPKFAGFERLEELHLIRNRITTLDDLVGAVCLPRLRRLFLEGNLVMKDFIPKHLLPVRRQVRYQPDTDIYRLFSSLYGITIADACFQPPRSNVEDELVAIGPVAKGGNVMRLQRQQLKPPIKRPHFVGNYLRKTAQVQMGHHVVPHIVQDAPIVASKSLARDRQTRRRYQFTDEDLKEIVKYGRIPPVKELVHMAEVREAQLNGELDSQVQLGGGGLKRSGMPRERSESSGAFAADGHHDDDAGIFGGFNHATQESDDQQSHASALAGTDMAASVGLASKPSDSQWSEAESGYEPRLPRRSVEGRGSVASSMRSYDTFGESMTSSLREIMYDPNHIDDTFLTGVHITGSRRGPPARSRLAAGERLDEESGEETSEGEAEEAEGEEEDDDDEYSTSDDDSSGSSWSGSSDSEGKMDPEFEKKLNTVYPLPNTIQESVRALRHALTNPISYWRVLEESYARPTFASLKHKTSYVTREQLRNEAISTAKTIDEEMSMRSKASHESTLTTGPAINTPANSVWTPNHGEDAFVSLSEYTPPTNITGLNRAPVGTVKYRRPANGDGMAKSSLLGSEDQQRLEHQIEVKLRQRKGAAATRTQPIGIASIFDRAPGLLSGRGLIARMSPKMDAIRNRQDMMRKLASTAALQRAHDAGRMRPKDEFEELGNLMSLLQGEYKRIESMYLQDAKNIIQTEPLTQRLQKLGIAGVESSL
nr:hypothetical protein HK105_002605 [Polyrhizophydium stewartii]